VFAIQLDHLARLGGTQSEEGPSARDRVDLARELTGTKDGEESRGRAGGTHNLELTGGHHKEPRTPVSLLDEDFASLDCAHVPVRRCARDLRRGQDWKSLGSSIKRAESRQ
jgi:hypothetical protein